MRGYTGKDVDGKTTQVSRTVYGTKKDAKLAAAELTVKPSRNAGGRKLRQLLDEWVDIKTPGWADLTVRDQTSRAKQLAEDPIGNMSVASIGVSDVDRWVACLRKGGVGEGAIRNQHTVLRSALQQAVRWEWVATNPASSARIESPKRQQQRTLTNDEFRAVIAAAADVHELAPLAFRLGAEMGARRSELAALRWDRFVGDKEVVDGQIIFSTDADGVRAARLKPTKTGSFDWPAYIARELPDVAPDAVVVIFGGNDAQDVTLGGERFNVGTTAWFDLYTSRVSEAMDVLVAGTERVYWIGLPIMRSDSLTGRVQTVNSVYESEAAERAQVTYISSFELFMDESGEYHAFLEGKQMRFSDGAHFVWNGAYRLADAVLPVITNEWAIETER